MLKTITVIYAIGYVCICVLFFFNVIIINPELGKSAIATGVPMNPIAKGCVDTLEADGIQWDQWDLFNCVYDASNGKLPKIKGISERE